MKPTLASHQVETLRLIADGYTDAEIARRLSFAPSSISSRVRTLAQKLEARNRAHAVAEAFRCGILAVEPAQVERLVVHGEDGDVFAVLAVSAGGH